MSPASEEIQPRADRENIAALIPAMRAFARTFYPDPTDADDLVQDTLLKGLAHLDKFEPGTRMKSWLFTIMRNTFYNRIRKEKRERPGVADCVSVKPKVSATQEWSARGRELAEALNRLPPTHREIIMLICVLGTPYDAAAEICGCEIGTIKSRLHRARSSLLTELGEDSFGSVLQGVSETVDDGRRRSR